MSEQLYKILGPGNASCHGGNGRWRNGRWRSVRGPLEACNNGLHLCRAQDITEWLIEDCIIWAAEADGEVVECEDKVVVRRARITKLLGTLDARALRLLACRYVRETPLHDGRKVWDLLTDERSRRAVEIAELYADWKATLSELAAARAAALAAVWDAALAAARAAAGAAARAAAGAAARAAEDAARAAAWDAAGAAVWDAVWDAARAAAMAAQDRMVLEALEVKP